MRRLTVIFIGCACLYAAAALSQSSRNVVPENCHDKQQLQMLSSGDPVAGDTGKVTCTVKYWACGQHFTQSQVTQNQPGACERFTNSVRSKVGTEACCDCFPKCAVGEPGKRKPSVAASETTKSTSTECCGKVEQLEEQLRQLEARLKTLEDRLSGEEVTLNAAGSSIKLRSGKTGPGVVITSDQDISIASSKDISISSSKNVSIKASGNLILKGTKVQQN